MPLDTAGITRSYLSASNDTNGSLMLGLNQDFENEEEEEEEEEEEAEDEEEEEEEEEYTIKCICESAEDDGNTMYCETCDTWQHIKCFYPGGAKETSHPEFFHSCADCKPRPLDRRRAMGLQQHQSQNKVSSGNGDKRTKRPPTKTHKKKTKTFDLLGNIYHDQSIRARNDQTPYEGALLPSLPQAQGIPAQNAGQPLQGQNAGDSNTVNVPIPTVNNPILFVNKQEEESFRMETGDDGSAIHERPIQLYFPDHTQTWDTNMGGISPQGLCAPLSVPRDSTMNLTSSSTFNDYPEYTDNFDVSPFVGNGDLDATLGDSWYPLFPQDNQTEPPQDQQSPLFSEGELEVSKHVRSGDSQRRSGTAAAPPGTHSFDSVIGARRRETPLPPIIVDDPSDTAAIRRARNTLAARKSRQRKMQQFDILEEQIAKLEKERDHFKNMALSRGVNTIEDTVLVEAGASISVMDKEVVDMDQLRKHFDEDHTSRGDHRMAG